MTDNVEKPSHYTFGKYESLKCQRWKMTDNVEKPSHYTFGKYECIDVIEELSKQNNLQGIEGFLYGNIIKYLWRYKHKNGIEDLHKARWYLDRLISHTENDYKPVGEKENGI